MPNLTLTELARADGMVWIKAETSIERDWFQEFEGGFIWHNTNRDSRILICGSRWDVQVNWEYPLCLVPESDEPRLREIERRVNKVPNA